MKKSKYNSLKDTKWGGGGGGGLFCSKKVVALFDLCAVMHLKLVRACVCVLACAATLAPPARF